LDTETKAQEEAAGVRNGCVKKNLGRDINGSEEKCSHYERFDYRRRRSTAASDAETTVLDRISINY